MRYLVALFLASMLMVGLVSAEEEEEKQQFIIIDEEGIGWLLLEDGSRVPFALEDLEVLANRPDPQEPGICINSENFTLWYGQDWHVCFVDEWEPIETPLLDVMPGASLTVGDFVSNDSHHTVEAVIEDIEVVEEWSGEDQNGYSGILNFNPMTGIEPTVTFIVDTVPPLEGRGGPLSYTITAKIGPLEATSPAFEQNPLHRLRQEYIDLDQNHTPEASDFDQDAAAHYRLADPADTHDHHEGWHILTETNTRATTLVNAASDITFMFPSGYRCPVRNRNLTGAAIESQHIYGTAFDFDVTVNSDSLNTAQLYILYHTLINTPTLQPRSIWLYDQNSNMIPTDVTIPAHPAMPPGVTQYTKGHADWR